MPSLGVECKLIVYNWVDNGTIFRQPTSLKKGNSRKHLCNSTGGTSTGSCLSPTDLFIVLFTEIEGDLRVVVHGISMLSFQTVRLVRSRPRRSQALLLSPTRLPGTYVERLCSERSRGPSADLSIASSRPSFPLQLLHLHVFKATFATSTSLVSMCSNFWLSFRSVPFRTRRFPTLAIGSRPPVWSRLAVCDSPAPWSSLAPPSRAARAHASSREDVARAAPFVAEP